MKTIACVIYITALAVAAYGADNARGKVNRHAKPSNPNRQVDPNMAKLLKLHLAFKDGDAPRFIVTLTNDSDSSLRVAVKPDIFCGLFRDIAKPGERKYEIYDNRYWRTKGTGVNFTPNQILEGHRTMSWNVPISNLIDSKTRKTVLKDQISGLLFEAYFEKIAILPLEITVGSYHEINAAMVSNQIRIP